MKTTHEKAKENYHNQLVENLQTMLNKNVEAEKGYKNAMENAESDTLKGYLQQQAAQRARFITQLDEEIRRLNESPEYDTSFKSDMHRIWMNVKTTFSGDTDEAVLEECIRGEESSVEAYNNTLEENNFPPHLDSVLKSQAEEVRASLRTAKQLEVLEANWS